MRAVLLISRGSLTPALMVAAFLTGLALGTWVAVLPHFMAADAPQVDPRIAAVNMLRQRFETLLDGNTDRLRANYELDAVSGEWAWEKELARARYLRTWLAERGRALTGARAWFEIDDVSSHSPDRFRLEITEHALYQYVRLGAAPGPDHLLGSRTVHVLEVVRRGVRWQIEYDWYLDPLGDGSGEPSRGAAAAGDPPRLGATAQRYDREKAVAYAVAHSGVRSVPGGGRYNKAYQVYSYEGGDCANFASQVLSTGGLTQGYGWFHDRDGSVAWTCSGDLVWYLLASGRGRAVFRGQFAEAILPSAESPRGPIGLLEPGDMIGYETEGQISHVAVIVDFDPSGWPVIASHTADRLFFPWDLGWDGDTVFWFVRIVY